MENGIKHGDHARNVMCDAVLSLINAGPNNGHLYIIDDDPANGTGYESGNDIAPDLATDADVVAGAGTWTTVIAKMEFATVAFQDAGLPRDDGETILGGRNGTAHANEVQADDDCNAGTATRFEIVDGNDPPNLILQGSITNADPNNPDPGDILLTSVGISAGDTIAIRNLSYTCAP